MYFLYTILFILTYKFIMIQRISGNINYLGACFFARASLVAQLVKNPPAMRETWLQSLGWEDPLEKGKATTPVFWTGEFHGLYSPWGF